MIYVFKKRRGLMVLLSYIFVYIFCIFMLGKVCEIELDDIICVL